MKRKKKSWDVSWYSMLLTSARAGGQLILVAVMAAVARDVGVSRFGSVVAAVSLATVLSGLIDFGAGSYWVREFSAGRLAVDELRKRSSSKVGVGFLTAVFLVGVSVVLSSGFYLFAGVLLLASVISQTSQILLIAGRRNVQLSVLVFVERAVLGIYFMFMTVLANAAPEFSLVGGYLVGALSLALLTTMIVPELRPSIELGAFKRTWAGAGYYGIATCLVSLQSLDVLIGGLVGGEIAVGVYGAVSRWTMPVMLVTQSFATLLNPIVSAAVDRDDVWRRMRNAIWIPFVSVVAAIVMALLAEPLVTSILGDAFVGSVTVLRWAALSAALSSMAQIAFTVLQARRREKVVAFGFALSVGSQLVLVAPLVYSLGALGLALAAVAGQGLLCVMLSGALLVAIRRGGRRVPAARGRRSAADPGNYV